MLHVGDIDVEPVDTHLRVHAALLGEGGHMAHARLSSAGMWLAEVV